MPVAHGQPPTRATSHCKHVRMAAFHVQHLMLHVGPTGSSIRYQHMHALLGSQPHASRRVQCSLLPTHSCNVPSPQSVLLGRRPPRYGLQYDRQAKLALVNLRLRAHAQRADAHFVLRPRHVLTPVFPPAAAHGEALLVPTRGATRPKALHRAGTHKHRSLVRYRLQSASGTLLSILGLVTWEPRRGNWQVRRRPQQMPGY